MDGTASIITVNPTAKPVGAMYPELGMSRVRSRFNAEGETLARERSGRQLRMWFGATGIRPGGSVALLALRLAVAVMLAMVVFPAVSGVTAAAALVAAASLVCGFGTRLIGGSAAVVFGLAACNELSLDLIPVLAAPSALMLGLIAYIGPGRYSTDSIVRRGLFRAIKRRETRRLLANRFSYRAFEYAHRMK
ncbi:MAG: hypothetical protein HDR80_02305 [Bacteroides sp.]|nr:hypothetical protein [Bacteroides sp.]